MAKSRFLATMSHELRTPLHAIIGMADLLHSTPLESAQRDMVQTVRSAGRNLLEMIGDVLNIARIESEQADPTVDFDLHALLATVHALLHHQAVEKGLSLHLEIDPAVPHQPSRGAPVVAADFDQPHRQRDQVHRAWRRDHPPDQRSRSGTSW